MSPQKKRGAALAKKMVETFGTTTDARRTAYVMPNGAQITYRGTAQITHGGMARAVGATGVDDFVCATGAIKLHAWKSENVIFACAYRPTRKQQQVLNAFIHSRRPGSANELNVEVVKPGGSWAGVCSLPATARVDDVVGCITEHRPPRRVPARRAAPGRRVAS